MSLSFPIRHQRSAKAATLLLTVLLGLIVMPMYSRVNDTVPGDWVPMPLSKTIGTSALIVYGQVSRVLDSTFLLKPVRRMAGDDKETVIEIVKARTDRFAGVQPAPYRAGQYYLCFLEPAKATAKMIWQVRGIARENQLPVIDNYVYFNDRHIEGLPAGQYSVYGVAQEIQRFDFGLFVNAVEDYRKYYRWVLKDNKYLPQKTGADSAIAAYRRKSVLHDRLVAETLPFQDSK